mmetsp:Transcript_69371/g.123586  ORF Transcript_69371/g.123586 Transcript_69371/m.123586 type:complete len:180 (+) Transcript_69371:63-602(+)
MIRVHEFVFLVLCCSGPHQGGRGIAPCSAVRDDQQINHRALEVGVVGFHHVSRSGNMSKKTNNITQLFLQTLSKSFPYHRSEVKCKVLDQKKLVGIEYEDGDKYMYFPDSTSFEKQTKIKKINGKGGIWYKSKDWATSYTESGTEWVEGVTYNIWISAGTEDWDPGESPGILTACGSFA